MLQLWRLLLLPSPLHIQLTGGHPTTRYKPVYLLFGDLLESLQTVKFLLWVIAVHSQRLTPGWVCGVIVHPHSSTRPSFGMSRVICSSSNITSWSGPTLAATSAYLASIACSRYTLHCLDASPMKLNITGKHKNRHGHFATALI